MDDGGDTWQALEANGADVDAFSITAAAEDRDVHRCVDLPLDPHPSGVCDVQCILCRGVGLELQPWARTLGSSRVLSFSCILNACSCEDSPGQSPCLPVVCAGAR